MKKLTYIILLAVFVLSCSNERRNKYFLTNNEIKNVLINFQESEVPNKDKIILIELYGDISKKTYAIRKIKYPYLFDNHYNYYIIELNATFFFFSSPFVNDVDTGIDTANVKRIIEEVYVEYNDQEGYEIDFKDIHNAWYYLHDGPPELFNMTDSIKIHKNIEEQYLKLDSIISSWEK